MPNKPPKNEPRIVSPIIVSLFFSSRVRGTTASSMVRIRGGAPSSTLRASTSAAILRAASCIWATSSVSAWRSSVLAFKV